MRDGRTNVRTELLIVITLGYSTHSPTSLRVLNRQCKEQSLNGMAIGTKCGGRTDMRRQTDPYTFSLTD